MTLKQKLTGATLTAVLAMALVMAVIIGKSYYQFGNQAVYVKTQAVAAAVSHKLSEWIASQGQIVASAAQSQRQGHSESALIQARLSGDFYDVYFGTATGEMHLSVDDEMPEGFDPRTRDWYQEASAQNGMIITSSYQDVTTKETLVSVALPVTHNGQQLGVVAGDIILDDLIHDLTQVNLGEGSRVFLLENDLVLGHANSDLMQKPATNIHPDLRQAVISSAIDAKQLVPFETADNTYLMYFQPINGTNWTLVVELDKSIEFAAVYDAIKAVAVMSLIITAVIGVAISALIGFLFRDLGRVSEALSTIAQGKGDLTQRLEPRTKDEVGELAHNFNQFVSHMHAMVTRMKSVADQLGAQSHQTATQATHRAHNISVQQDNIASVAAAIEEMATTTNEVASNAEQTARTAHVSVQLSDSGAAQVGTSQASISMLASEVQTATDVINALNEHTQNINTILSAIQEIAEQTNLLALNAAIEAARAGEQGRGFAVVADEVRVLSQRTHDSTAEIQSTIETLKRITKEAVTHMTDSRQLAETSVVDANQAVSSLQDITKAINEISDMATHIASAAEEQSLVTQDITRNTQSVRSVSDELAVEAQEAVEQASALAELANQLKSEVEKFRV
uniref:methyl-accepting chemotaxis protein n=1 Tax=Thaumasiovibrio occultus TaxID=1891184 RepID=UPI000B363139|nr:methyl-accepting chemotaxis protein [Thaumasiovibrio occultus]